MSLSSKEKLHWRAASIIGKLARTADYEPPFSEELRAKEPVVVKDDSGELRGVKPIEIDFDIHPD